MNVKSSNQIGSIINQIEANKNNYSVLKRDVLPLLSKALFEDAIKNEGKELSRNKTRLIKQLSKIVNKQNPKPLDKHLKKLKSYVDYLDNKVKNLNKKITDSRKDNIVTRLFSNVFYGLQKKIALSKLNPRKKELVEKMCKSFVLNKFSKMLIDLNSGKLEAEFKEYVINRKKENEKISVMMKTMEKE
jgi:hypothetical protein